MGSAISAMIDAQVQEEKDKARDALNSLLALADTKFQVFSSNLHNDTDAKLIPTDRILLEDHQVQASVTQNGDGIKNAVTTAAGAFAKGDILDGLVAVVDFGIDAVLGNVAANQSQHDTYAITVGNLGGLMRVDIQVFCYTFESQALASVANNVVSVAYAISSVDGSKLDKNTLRDIVQVCYGGVVDQDKLQAIYQQVLEAYGIMVDPTLPAKQAVAPPKLEAPGKAPAKAPTASIAHTTSPIHK